MRYILNDEGYVYNVSFGAEIQCSLGTCTEYAGEIPQAVNGNEQHASLEEWHDVEVANNRLNAWKIVDGNLVYDENKYNELKKIYEEQAKKNAPATHEYVDTRINGIKIENKDLKALFDKSSYEGFEIATLNDASDFEIDKLVIHTTTKEKQINLALSTSNMLYHELVATEKEGVSFTVNEDKSINVKGTSNSPFEIDILGDSENTNPFFVFKKGYNYYLNPILDSNAVNSIEWNGDETSKEVITEEFEIMQGTPMNFYKVSDEILSEDELVGKVMKLNNSDGSIDEYTITESDYDSNLYEGTIVILNNGYIPAILVVTETTETRPYSTGTYFLKLEMGDMSTYVSSLSLNGIQLNMYNYDGNTKTQVYSGTGGSILFTDETKPVTNVTLSLNGKYNTTLFPMLNLGETAMEYEEGKYELITIDLPEYTPLYPNDTLYPSEDEYPCFWGDIALRIEGGKVFLTDESERELISLLTPKTYSTKTTVYTFEDSTLDLNYITCYSNGVPYDEVIKSINNSPEKITIEANKIDVKGVLSVLGESGSTVINGNNITTGKIKADCLDTSKINATQGSVGGWTINSSKLGGTNTYLNPNGSCQFYPSGGSIVAWNNAIRLKGPQGIGIYNTHTNYGSSTDITNGINIMADAGNLNLMNESSSYGVNVRAYCSSNTIGDAGARSIRLAAGANIAMYAVGGYCYAEGSGVSSAKIKTDSGSASSKNVKTNIEEFSEDEYNSSLELLDKMKIYNYDYKYDLYKDKEQYGFILDEIEELDNKFFKITEEEAIIKGEHLDFNLDNKKDTDNTINVKKYDSDALDKYLLTVCKALLNKVNTLENKIKEMESDK